MPISTIPPSQRRPLDDPNDQTEVILQDTGFDAQVQGLQKIGTLNELMSQSRGQISNLVNGSIAAAQGNFEQVKEQVDSGALEIGLQVGETISDPDVRNEYDRQLEALKQTELLKAKGLVQQQQLQRLDSSFRAEHDALIQQIQGDPLTPVSVFAEEFGQKIAIAKSSGLYSEEEASQLYQSFLSDAGRAKAQAMIALDPIGTKSLLEADPGQFKLEGEELSQMIDLANTTISDNEIAAAQAERDRQDANSTQRQFLKADLYNKLDSGQLTEAEIDVNRNMLSDEDLGAIKQDLLVKREEKVKADSIRNQIISRVEAGEDLNDFRPSDRNRVFNEAVELGKQLAGVPADQPASLSLKANMARFFKGNIPVMERELEFSLKEGNDEEGIEALNAYRVLQQQNPQALSGLNKEHHAIAAFALTLIDKTGAQDQQALARARLNADADQDIRKERGASFSRLDSVRAQNIEDTAREALGGDPFFGFDATLSPGVAEDFRDLAREAYTIIGDEDGALASASQQMKRFYGKTEFNGGNHIMFAPPEKMFPGVKPEVIKDEFNSTVLAAFPSIDVDKLQIVGDDLTRMREGKVSYAIIATDSNGIPFQLQDPETGELLRWEVTKDDFIRRKKLEEAELERFRVEQKQGVQKLNEINGQTPDFRAI